MKKEQYEEGFVSCRFSFHGHRSTTGKKRRAVSRGHSTKLHLKLLLTEDLPSPSVSSTKLLQKKEVQIIQIPLTEQDKQTFVLLWKVDDESSFCKGPPFSRNFGGSFSAISKPNFTTEHSSENKL
jgi:hypothetical protein